MTTEASMRALLDEYYTCYAYLRVHEAPLKRIAEETLLNKCIKVFNSHECEDWYRPVYDRLFKLCLVECSGREVEYVKVYRVAVYYDTDPLTALGEKCEPFENLVTEEDLYHLADSLESFSEMVTKRDACSKRLDDLAHSGEFDAMFYRDSIIRRESFISDMVGAMEHRYDMARVV